MSATELAAAGLPWWRTFLERWAAWNERHGRARHLHVNESVSLGEKKFVAVVQFERQRFLVGGTGTSLSLLAELKHDEPAGSPGGGISEES